jgi:acyl transferase domain-containing protein
MGHKTIFLFSGQGSQYFHMGKALYERNRDFRDWMQRLDAVASALAGTSVVETIYSGTKTKGDPFDRTLLTHPAIFMVEYSLAQTLMQAGVQPDMVLGASMGSFAAAAVAGLIGVEEALTAVVRQASAVEEWGEPGGMIAVMAEPALFEEELLRGHSELAAVNFDTHFVVSAKRTELARIEAVLKERKITHQRLPVSVAFHSQWIDRAKAPFGAFMRSVPVRQGRLPLVCCDRTTTLSALPEDYFWDVVRHPIRFREATARLEREGASRYIDVGPAGTLATFLKYGLPAGTTSTIHAILTPFGTDERNLNALLAPAGH